MSKFFRRIRHKPQTNRRQILAQMKTPLLFSIILLVSGMGYSQSTTKTFHHDNKTYRYEEFNEVTEPVALLVLFNGGSGIASIIPRESSLADSAANYQIKTIGIDQSEFYLADWEKMRLTGFLTITNGISVR
jgi:hypothetical protein